MWDGEQGLIKGQIAKGKQLLSTTVARRKTNYIHIEGSRARAAESWS